MVFFFKFNKFKKVFLDVYFYLFIFQFYPTKSQKVMIPKTSFWHYFEISMTRSYKYAKYTFFFFIIDATRQLKIKFFLNLILMEGFQQTIHVVISSELTKKWGCNGPKPAATSSSRRRLLPLEGLHGGAQDKFMRKLILG